MTQRTELLQAMPLFGAIGDEALLFLLERSRERDVPAGGWFFREGDSADAMYVLESGRVEVIKHWQAREFVLHAFAAGDCFGEMALLDLAPRSASVRALEDCHALEIGAEALYALCKHDTEQFALIQMNIGREVCRRLRATDDALFRASMGERGALPGPWPRAA